MAKFVGLIGTISGKVGTTVFTKGEKGLSYGRAYQPQVANPKTIGQQDQRAKMNLVGRMSQVTPKAILVGMNGENNRQRRSAFNRILLNAATVSRPGSGAIIAQVDPEDVVFSQGAEVFSAELTGAAVAARSVSGVLKLNDASLAGRYGERIIVAVIDPRDKAGYSQVRYTDVTLDNVEDRNWNIAFGEDIEDESLVCIYRVPYVFNEEGAAMHTETLANNGADITAQLLASASAYVRGFGNSLLHSSQVFTQA